MTRRELICGAPALLTAAGRRRNIVFVLTDDHRYDMMGCQGHPFVRTPNLDRLAGGGVLFENAFVTTSLCSPSRASILTGKYVHAHGVADNVAPLPARMTTFPQLLQQQGYRTALIGKWHMGGNSDDPRPGFDRWVSFRGQGRYTNPVLNRDGRREQAQGYVTDILTDEALKFLDESASRPFMLFLSHKAVHASCTPAKRHANLYSDVPIPKPDSFPNTDETYRGKPDWVRRQRASFHGVDGMYNEATTFDDFYRDYCRTLAGVDESVGRVMTALEEKNMLNDTLFVYMGDNGFQFGEHGLIDKRTMYEPSMRVPMIAHCPDLFQGGRRVEGMALGIDIHPTMLEAAAVSGPPVHGKSLLPLIRRTGEWRKEFLYEYFWERNFPQTPTVMGLRTDRYSFMRYYGVWDLDELYDVRQDPHQRNNLLANVRVRTEGGRSLQRMEDQELKRLVMDLQARVDRILAETEGQPNPTWRAWH